jgi:hypothetical protein
MLNVTGFQPGQLGSPREVRAAFELFSRATEPSFAEDDLGGEQDIDTETKIRRFIDLGEMPESESSGIFNLIGEGNATGAESRVDRLKAVIEAGMELLEAAKGPGLNLLNVVGRTGLIIVLATLLREYVASLVVHATREGDTPEASQAWAAVALAMTGPALTLIGAIGREFAGEATLRSRLSCLCMASAVMGSTIMACVTGTASKLLPAMTGGVVYTMARAVAEAFFPLKDNAERANVLATGVTATVHGTLYGMLRELGSVMPLSGSARAAAELGYDFGADAIQAGLNGLGMVVDTVVSILCKSWHVLSPSQGLDSALSDPESLQQMVLEVRAGVQRPTRAQLADALTLGGLRLSFGHAVNLVGGAVALWLSEAEIGDDTQGHIVNGCLAVMMMLLYFPLIFGNLKSTDHTYALPQETPVP